MSIKFKYFGQIMAFAYLSTAFRARNGTDNVYKLGAHMAVTSVCSRKYIRNPNNLLVLISYCDHILRCNMNCRRDA